MFQSAENEVGPNAFKMDTPLKNPKYIYTLLSPLCDLLRWFVVGVAQLERLSVEKSAFS